MPRKVFLALLFAVCITVPVYAGGYPDTEYYPDAKFDHLEKMMQDQAQIIKSLQNKVHTLQKKKASRIQSLPATSNQYVRETESWTDRIKWFGDFRLRHQILGDKAAGPVRNRTRMRVRPGLKAKVNEDIDFIFRLTTSQSPASGNQTFDDYFDSKDIFIDLAYVHYHPTEIFGKEIANDIIKNVHLFGGKMKNPFYRAGKNQVIFDSDVTPEGGAAKIKMVCPITGLHLWTTVGGFVVEENPNGADASLWGIQGGFKEDLGDLENLGNVKLISGISYYDYGSIKGHSLPTQGALGNKTKLNFLDENLFAHDFDILEFFSELQINPLDIPVAIYGTYVVNVATGEDHQAWIVGTKLGKTKNIGDWEADYSFRRVEADSVMGIFTHSDFLNGGTDGYGHEINIGYKIAKNVKAKTTLFIVRKNIEHADDFWNLEFDINFYW